MRRLVLWLVIIPAFVLVGIPASILCGFVLARGTERRKVPVMAKRRVVAAPQDFDQLVVLH